MNSTAICYANLVHAAEMPDRTTVAATMLLPLSTKDNKDGKVKEESHKLLNGNSVVDPADRVS